MASVIKEVLKDDDKLRQVTKAAFELIDLRHSGFLETDELYEIISGSMKKKRRSSKDLDSGFDQLDAPSREDVEAVLKEIDENGDGKLSLDEFQELIEQVLEMMVQDQ